MHVVALAHHHALFIEGNRLLILNGCTLSVALRLDIQLPFSAEHASFHVFGIGAYANDQLKGRSSFVCSACETSTKLCLKYGGKERRGEKNY